ncbi:hypothetical protein QBC38DRAFT_45786 [Podospora fimiseda]|uniref:Ankyrin repeat protein n=1 Tax=Podospora fimiseda TaxID=252190 RepID=A0AAN7BI06_9PEZI|nr:hypothetical protein QBC38DRAFT_45786 [Podospora fimiseda]
MLNPEAPDIQLQNTSQGAPGDFHYTMADDWGPGDESEEEDQLDLGTSLLTGDIGDVAVDQTKLDTEFWRACHQGKIPQVKRLLELGADVNTQRKYYMSKMARFIEYDNTVFSDEPDLDPDTLASGDKSNNPELEDELAWWGERKAWSVGEVSAIFAAIVQQHFDVAGILLDHEAISLQETYTPDKRTAFYQAVLEKGSEDLLKRFLALSSAETFRNISNYRGWAPLHWCAYNGDMVKTRLLLQGKVHVDVKDDGGSSPLLTAVRSCPARIDVEITRLLLMYGADVNLKNKEGNTALHEAAEGEFVRLVNLLLTWGADEGLINDKGKKPIELISDKRSDVKTLLNPVNVRKVKKERRDPWKEPIEAPSKMCDEFSLKVTFGRRSLSGSGNVRTETETIFDFVYRHNTSLTLEDRLEEAYIRSQEGTDSTAPDVSPDDIWKWIHIPSNNMTWIKDLLASMFHSSNRKDRREEYWNMIEFFEAKCVSSQGASRQLKPHMESASPNTSKEPKWVSMAIPYLDFESDQFLDRESETTDATNKHKNLVNLGSQYSKFNGEYGVQHPQTLDESYYDSLEGKSLSDRNKDQVVYKWFSRHSSDDNDKHDSLDGDLEPPKLLMVNQLWLWKLGDGTIITAFPDRWHDGPEHTLYEAIRQDIPNHVWKTSDMLIEYLVSACVTFPHISSNVRLGFDILDTFESWVGLLSFQEVTLFKDFRNFLKSSRREERSSGETHLSITEEVGLTYELRDVVDELFILNRVCTTQKDLVTQYLQQPYKRRQETNSGAQLNGWNALQDVERFIEHTERLENKAKKVIENLDKLVQIKQAQSALHESRVATVEAERAHRLNNYIMLFTVVTVVFTPLSFMTSIFALAVDQFPHNDDGEPRYIASWIAKRLITGELTSLSVILAGFLLLRSGRKKRRQKELVEMEPEPKVLNVRQLKDSARDEKKAPAATTEVVKLRKRIPTMESIKKWKGKESLKSWKRGKKVGDVEEQVIEGEGNVLSRKEGE